MLFEKDEDLELQPKRTKTLLISLGIHMLLVLFIAFNPELLTGPPKRVIRIMGQDYDLSKQQLTELVVPPNSLRPKPAVPDKPLVQPPAPKPENQPAPPPPQPQQQKQQPPPPPPPPPQVIGPDDILKEGARPDAQPKGSRGDTTEQARAGSQEQPKPEPPKPQQQRAQNNPPQLAQNNNPDSLRLPNLMNNAEKIVQADSDASRKRYSQGAPGPRTGTPNGQEDPNFSTEEPTILSDTKGYDFGPYMNQVVNRVRYNWYSLIPEIARLGKKGRVVIIFTINSSGGIEGARIAANSGTDPLDRAAFGSITASNPFAKLPSGFSGDHIDLQFTFLYNIR